jgi:peptidyl-prolyl cis-trans isomerase SurA
MKTASFSRVFALLVLACAAQGVLAQQPGLAMTSARLQPVPVDRVVAVVNNEAITEREWLQRCAALERRLRAQGMQLPPEAIFRKQVLERMAADLAIQQTARNIGIRVDDAAIDRGIARLAQEANLTPDQMRQQLAAEGVEFDAFRQEVARELVVSRLREREIDSRLQVSEAEIDAWLDEQRNAPAEYNIDQILVKVPEDAPPAEVERLRQRAEVIARGARGGVDFNRIAQSYEAAGDPVTGGNSGLRTADRLPESFVQAVAKLPVGEIAPVLRTPAGFHIIRLVERRGGGGETVSAPVRQTRARHILMRINETNPEPEVLRRMNEIRERIVAGTVSFEDMARQYSVDGSAGQGGDLGWIYPGDTVPDFETAMNLLKPGEISPAVRSPFGYHLIQVQERRTDEASPERARSAARNAIRLRKSNEGYQEWSSQARDRAYIEYRIEDQ